MLWQNFRADYFQLEFQLQPSFAHKRIIKVCCNLTTRPIGLLILKFGRVRNIFEWPLEFISAIAHVCIYLFLLCVNLHIIIIFCLDDFYLLLLFSPRLFMVLPEFTMFCLAGYSRLKLRPFVSGSPRSPQGLGNLSCFCFAVSIMQPSKLLGVYDEFSYSGKDEQVIRIIYIKGS